MKQDKIEAEAKRLAKPFDAKGFLRLSPGGTKPAGRQIGLVDGARVTVMTLALPAGLQGAAREKVARRQVADLTGQPVEALDVRPFHGPGGAPAWDRVLVADATEVAGWRAQAGPGARAVLPDYLALPAGEGLWVVAVEGERAMARLGVTDGFAAPLELASALLERAWDEAGEGERPKAIFLMGEAVSGLDTWADGQGVPLLREAAALDKLGLAAPKVLAHGEAGFDLRRDPQAARAKLRARVLPWRWPVLAGLVAAVLWASGQYLATQRLNQERRDLAVATTALVREHFVPEGPILDIRTQVARALAARQAGAGDGAGEAGPLDLFGAAAGVMAAQKAGIRLVNYGASQGLEITVRTEDFAALDALVAALDTAGLRIEVAQSRTVEGGGAEARLKLSAGKGEVSQ